MATSCPASKSPNWVNSVSSGRRGSKSRFPRPIACTSSAVQAARSSHPVSGSQPSDRLPSEQQPRKGASSPQPVFHSDAPRASYSAITHPLAGVLRVCPTPVGTAKEEKALGPSRWHLQPLMGGSAATDKAMEERWNRILLLTLRAALSRQLSEKQVGPDPGRHARGDLTFPAGVELLPRLPTKSTRRSLRRWRQILDYPDPSWGFRKTASATSGVATADCPPRYRFDPLSWTNMGGLAW